MKGAPMRGEGTREILQTVIDSGQDGIKASGVIDILRAYDVCITSSAIRSILSRMKREGVLEIRDSRYYVARR